MTRVQQTTSTPSSFAQVALVLAIVNAVGTASGKRSEEFVATRPQRSEQGSLGDCGLWRCRLASILAEVALGSLERSSEVLGGSSVAVLTASSRREARSR